jgi:hypothetical protein
LIDGFAEPCAELCLENDRWNREIDRSFYVHVLVSSHRRQCHRIVRSLHSWSIRLNRNCCSG